MIEFRGEDEDLHYSTSGYVTNSSYSGRKKSMLLLFINNRLVECAPLKRQLESLYALLLPKGSFPFIYLSLDLRKETVDGIF